VEKVNVYNVDIYSIVFYLSLPHICVNIIWVFKLQVLIKVYYCFHM